MKNKISVLGQEYKIEYHYREDDDDLSTWNGYCEPYNKKIIICKDIIDDAKGKTKATHTVNLDNYVYHIYRHEIIHAFFEESGMTYKYNSEEEDFLVDWLARQFPKMRKIFDELGVSE